MVRMRVGKKCTLEDIKVGEVFAINGCWVIAVKVSDDSQVMYLSDDSNFCLEGTIERVSLFFPKYKLPKSVQKLWITE